MNDPYCEICGQVIVPSSSAVFDTKDGQYRIAINVLVVDRRDTDGTPLSYRQLVVCRTDAKLLSMKDTDYAT